MLLIYFARSSIDNALGLLTLGGICMEHEAKQTKMREKETSKIVVIVIIIIIIIIPEKISNPCKTTKSVNITRYRQKVTKSAH